MMKILAKWWKWILLEEEKKTNFSKHRWRMHHITTYTFKTTQLLSQNSRVNMLSMQLFVNFVKCEKTIQTQKQNPHFTKATAKFWMEMILMCPQRIKIANFRYLKIQNFIVVEFETFRSTDWCWMLRRFGFYNYQLLWLKYSHL